MNMNRINLKQSLASAVFTGLFALCFAGCTNEDFPSHPEGSIPLELGDVTVAGMTTTRAAITEDPATGYTGIRKSRFVNGDVLKIESTNPRSGGTVTSTDNATLTGGAWVLDAKVYVIPGTTTIKATYSPTAPTGMLPDRLAADSYTLVGQKLKLDLKHVNALVDITCPAGITPTDITLIANDGNADQSRTAAAEEESDGTIHYRSILAPGTVKSITATINGNTYIATLTPALTVAANKRYPVALTFKTGELSATVGTGELNWGAGGDVDLLPPGYDFYISTPEDLAQYAKDANDDATGTGARTALVLQTANIDLSTLKPLADAQRDNPEKNYTYTATADNWVPIEEFLGTYNGNGYSISNLKIDTQENKTGFFYNAFGDCLLTGIHLRDVDIKGEGHIGSLAGYFSNGTITLCSATGSINSVSGDSDYIGGLIGGMGGSAHITRCSANVAISSTSTNADTRLGGLIGYENSGGDMSFIIGCMATGKVTGAGGCCTGLVGEVEYSTILGCVATGEVISSVGTAYALTGTVLGGGGGGGVIWVMSCYAKGKDGMEFGSDTDINYFWCAYTGSLSTTPSGVTGNTADANLYTTITASAAAVADNVNTLHWSRAEGYTTNLVNATWHALSLWKDNPGAAPTIDMTYEGE